VEAFPDPEWVSEARLETFPKFSRIVYEFGPRGDLPRARSPGTTGGQRPDPELHEPIKQGASGSLVIGEKGKIFSDNDYHGTYTLLPEENFVDYKKPEYVQSPGHFTEFAMPSRKASRNWPCRISRIPAG